MMQTRKLGNSQLHLSTVGLGTWAIGGGNWKFAWGPQDDAESIRSIHRALDLGVNWIDTAPAYGLGHAEEVVRQALHGLHERPIVATKCGRCWGADRQLVPRLKAESVRQEVEASLRRLGIDTIDLYQIHWPQPDEDIEEAWGVVADLVRAGKIRFAGVSNFNVDQLKRLQAIHPIASLQPPYSLLARGVEAEILPFCAAHNIGVVAYSPMQKGLLTGKITRAWLDALPTDDHRRNDPNFIEPKLTANLELVAGLQAVAGRLQTTVAQLAIAWVLRRPELTAAIVGVRKPSQIEETAPAGDLQIPVAEQEAIDQLLMIHAAAV